MNPKICPACGVRNRSNAKFCSDCGLSLTTGAAPSGPIYLQPGTLLENRFRIAQMLGKGGFGAVYLAMDMRLQRECVVKQMLPPDRQDYPTTKQWQKELHDLQSNFEREARSLIALNAPGHANIPEIYDSFDDPSGNYLVMKYIKGESLEQYMNRLAQPLPWREAVKISIQLASALEYMHNRTDLGGKPAPVLHRDIKPANILVDENNRVWLVDFGLSKAQPTTTKLGIQGGTTAAGTPGYAPWEQWVQKAVPASDLYSLGATLHHLVTGRDPRSVFTSFNLAAFQHHHANFPPIRTLNNTLPKDLEDAVAATLRDKPQDRPPITQWKVHLEKILRPQATGMPFYWQDGTLSRHPQELAQHANQHWDEARHYFTNGDWERWFKAIQDQQALTQMDAAKAQHKNADVALDAFLHTIDPTFSPANLQTNVSSLDFGTVPWSEKQTLKLELRNTGSGYLHGRITNLPKWVQVDSHEFGTLKQQTINVTVETRHLTPRTQPYSAPLTIDTGIGAQTQIPLSITVPEPQLLIDPPQLDFGKCHRGATLQNTLTVRNMGSSPFEGQVHSDATWITVQSPSFRCEPGQSTHLRVKINTNQMEFGAHHANVRIETQAGGWQQTEERQVTVRLLTTLWQRWWQRWAPTLDWAVVGMVLTVAPFIVVSTFLDTTEIGHEIRWEMNIAMREEDWLVLVMLMTVVSIPFLFFGGWLGLLMNRQESKSGGIIAKFRFPWEYNFRGATAGSLLAALGVWLGSYADTLYGFAPTIALAGLSGLVLWGSLRPPKRAKRHSWSGRFAVALFLPALIGSLYLASQPHFWWHQVRTLEGHTDHVESVAFNSDGLKLASGSVDHTVRLWQTSDGVLLSTLEGHSNTVWSVTFSPDEKMLASSSRDSTIRLWQTSDGTLINTLEQHTDMFVASVAFSPDGEFLAGGSSDAIVRLWRTSDGMLQGSLEGHTSSVASVAFSPDGQFLASGSLDDTVLLWRTSDGTLINTLKGHTDWISSVAFSPDGQILASGSADHTIRLWRTSDGTLQGSLEGHTHEVYEVAFSPAGQILASASARDGTIRLWRTNDGTLINTLQGHTDSVTSIAFSRDGQLLASGSYDDTVRLWRVGEWWK